ncbi:VOC family protein [Streptomyces ipomoeae]|jgi:predicted enzyme related to lactoylglutathione lyase|uniref:VOC family protein n=1 Tax=Streptomyces ipomoeae TaxID=103232 RepID=A0AAE8W438_9ACTN|nr:VOC family protein [Streptomyces ipomoeae]MDX2823644.1 VOC family protein [Streptomyces ipomoeae]MDX2873589.1 VOC family protein [Streptomyces ipomoeae]MDX2933815.1 VOC family protein [Streptomyces ipomoeae]TQE25777.1 VOC family protein [Streptomyces ipomoeae]TQE33973.1 VOC family protein [Streptomyces ipomoeae]
MKFDRPVTGGPCWTELGTSDLEAAKRFYTELFGWRPETDPRQEAGGYTIAHLGDAAVAALAPLYQESQPVAWNVSFAVSDADAMAQTVREAGGTIVMEPMDVFGLGRFAVALDANGAAFQLWQARTFPGAGLLNAPGTLGWVELLTRSPERAKAFYTTVFGWSVGGSESYPQWGLGGADFGGMVTMDDKFPHEVPSHWLPYFAVEDVDDTARIATEADGTILMEPTTVPDGPRIAVLRDPQGAMFGVYVAGEEG